MDKRLLKKSRTTMLKAIILIVLAAVMVLTAACSNEPGIDPGTTDTIISNPTELVPTDEKETAVPATDPGIVTPAETETPTPRGASGPPPNRSRANAFR